MGRVGYNEYRQVKGRAGYNDYRQAMGRVGYNEYRQTMCRAGYNEYRQATDRANYDENHLKHQIPGIGQKSCFLRASLSVSTKSAYSPITIYFI